MTTNNESNPSNTFSVSDALEEAKAQGANKRNNKANKQASPSPETPLPDLNQQHQDAQQQLDELLSGDSIIYNVQKRTQQELLAALHLQRQEDLEILQRGIQSGARKRDIYVAGEQLGFARAGNQASILPLLDQIEAIVQLAAQTEIPEKVQEQLPEEQLKQLSEIDIDAAITKQLGDRLTPEQLKETPGGKSLKPLALQGETRLTTPLLLLAGTAANHQ